MKLATITVAGQEEAAIVTDIGLVQIAKLNKAYGLTCPTSVLELLEQGELTRLSEWCRIEKDGKLADLASIAFEDAVYAPLYRYPRKIWGIGANYREKAEAMSVTPPEQEPICFMKPDTSLIGPGDEILLPAESDRVTAEAEIAIVIGKLCKNVSPEEAPQVIAGFAPTLDMTAQDIHARNPRFLGRSKCFDTFFSFGPQLLTLDEFPDVNALEVMTMHNGEEAYRGKVSQMIYSPWFLVSYFSKMMTLLPGDIIMTGTPGSVPLREGDTAGCQISGFESLINPVALG
ncbi:fumarylacetoacetate hydrolase [Bacillus sp. FJAT-27264]|uniref:fumarylacetoacetate hydrolase family protein n=1 Tax=Paenibacillus sp. (strain DSM 101736 / FJAT-27264) TaxID=1850362 RepID=UPI000807FEAF|nr:fumarylacetoacetate hydrolase family protein [Bacillus sp. FJAT-27264]OBZ19011.1 fumarylacetoacetate hydrolase [Bacillus sp. FJAT-27264]